MPICVLLGASIEPETGLEAFALLELVALVFLIAPLAFLVGIVAGVAGIVQTRREITIRAFRITILPQPYARAWRIS